MSETKKKRPPRSVWCAVTDSGAVVGVYPTKGAAGIGVKRALSTLNVVGPYVLAERVAQR